MRLPSLLFRWLIILGAGWLGLHYAWTHLDGPVPGYRTVPLVQGSKAVGLRLAGIAVDPKRRDVFAIAGREAKTDLPGDFFILWRGNDGEHCGLRFFDGEKGATTLWQLKRQGTALTSKDFTLEKSDGSEISPTNRSASAEAAVHSIVQALPNDFELFGKP